MLSKPASRNAGRTYKSAKAREMHPEMMSRRPRRRANGAIAMCGRRPRGPGGRGGALKGAIVICGRRPRGPGGREGAFKEAIAMCARRPRCPGGREGALKAGKAALAGCAFVLAGCEPVFAFAYFFRKTDACSLSRDVNPYSPSPISFAKQMRVCALGM